MHNLWSVAWEHDFDFNMSINKEGEERMDRAVNFE